MREMQLKLKQDPSTWKSLDELMTEGLDIAMPNLDVSVRQDLLSAWSNPLPWWEVLSALKELRQKGFVLGTMSNASEKMQREIAKVIGFDFDHYFSPDQVHAYKPEPAIFKQALKVGDGYKEDEVLMVANYTGDLDAAASLNLLKLLHKSIFSPMRPHRDKYTFLHLDNDKLTPDLTVGDLSLVG